MRRYFCVSVTFLDPWFHGCTNEGRNSEWPPSPLRLFQALLAGARTGSGNRNWSEERRSAFEWLEGQAPPEIVAPKVEIGRAHCLYVPNNQGDRKLDRQARLTEKVVRPTMLREGESLYYLWPIEDQQWSTPACRNAVEILVMEARRLLALGWGIDLVAGDGAMIGQADAYRLPGQRWRPWPEARPDGVALRVPTRGTLRDLERAHQEFLNRLDAERMSYMPRRPASVFGVVTYLPLTRFPRRPYARFNLTDLRGRWRSFAQSDAVHVAGLLRHRACEAAKSDSHRFEGGSEVYVAGHVPAVNQSPPRFSYLPLPSIGHAHADGLIRRALVAEHLGGAGNHARWVDARLAGSPLVDPKGEVRAILQAPEGTDRVYQLYTNEARRWASVTPVVLPGFDDGDQTKAERLFLKAWLQAGLPVECLEEFTLSKAPFWPGSLHVSLYRRPQDYLRHWPMWHVRLCLREPVSGPIAVGVGRHCGLGLLACTE